MNKNRIGMMGNFDKEKIIVNFIENNMLYYLFIHLC